MSTHGHGSLRSRVVGDKLTGLLLAAAAGLTTGAATGQSEWPDDVREVAVAGIDAAEQPAMFRRAVADEPRPLLVCLHTWSGDHRQRDPGARCASLCVASDWTFVQPNARGPNRNPEATGSELVVTDVLQAVRFARANANVDPARIYLFGVSGGGHLALLMAGRFPELWAGVSAWVPISDLSRWHRECSEAGRRYANDIVKSCGGVPGASAAVDRQYRRRSPLTWLEHARGVPIDINTGVRDGHRGSVPVGHAIRAFDVLAEPQDRVGRELLERIERDAQVPARELYRLEDPDYGEKPVLLRRTSGAARLTVFDGGHEGMPGAALRWLAGQMR